MRLLGILKFILCVDAFDVADSLLFEVFEVNYIILELIKEDISLIIFMPVSLKLDIQCNVSGNCVRCAVLISEGVYKAQKINVGDNCC